MVVPGCKMETRVVKDGWAQKLEGLPWERGSPDNLRGDKQTMWAIELDRMTGPDRVQRAQTVADQARAAGVGQVHVRDTGILATVSTGRVTDPKSGEAQALLRRVREAVVGGTTPFAGVEFRPVAGDAVADATEGYDPLDLKQFPGMYTLLIGYYDSTYGGNFRDAAVKSAQALREANVEAYYYHDPRKSMVTVGLFEQAAAFVQQENPMSPGTFIDVYSPYVKELQKTYPYIIGNSPTIDTGGQAMGDQPSSLVKVPN